MKNISLLDLLKNLALSLALSAFALIPAHAQLPSGTILIHSEAYDINLLFDSLYDTQIISAASTHPDNIWWNISGEWIDIFTRKNLKDFKAWPQIRHTDSKGFVTFYSPQNGHPIESDLKWKVSGEVLIDGPDGDPDSENYILLKFNKPLATADYSSVIEDLEDGQNNYLSVDGMTDLANIAAAEWNPDNPDELLLYISGAHVIPSPCKISFKLKSGAIVSADGGTLSNEYLNVSCIVSNSHFGE